MDKQSLRPGDLTYFGDERDLQAAEMFEQMYGGSLAVLKVAGLLLTAYMIVRIVEFFY